MKTLQKFKDKVTKTKGFAKFSANALMLSSALMMTAPAVFAENEGPEVIDAIIDIVALITNILGIIFIIIGFVKLVIAHAQEDAPGQQKAAMFIATGLILVLLRFVLDVIPFSNWLMPMTS